MSGKPVPEKDPEGSGTRLGRLLRLPAWVMWRFVIGGLACLALVAWAMYCSYLALQLPGLGFAVMYAVAVFGVPLALIGGSLLLVAYGFVRREEWPGTLALVQDLVLVIVAALMLADSLHEFATRGGSPALMIWWASAVGASGLLLAAEASHLLHAAWARRLAWPAYGAVAAGLLLICLIVPPVVNKRLVRHVGPLLAYARTHWFSIPPGSRISVSRVPLSGPGSEGHRDFVHVETENAVWDVRTHHLASGRWRIPEPILEQWVDFSVFHGRVPGRGGIRSVSAAQRLLEDVGVVDRDLRPERLPEGEKTVGPEIPPPSPRFLCKLCHRQWHEEVAPDIPPPASRFARPYQFWSPRGRGFYSVSEDGRIAFFVKHPLEVP
jgi:hypothetical protein